MVHNDSSVASGFDWQKLTDLLDGVLNEQLSKLGHVNIIVAGRTGTGKSTLINAVFGEDFAKTAMGKPVTQEATWYEKKGHSLRILDTKGLEASSYERTWEALKREIAKGRSSNDPDRHLHVGWVCIAEPGTRVEDAEKTLVDALKKERIPTIIVLTKHGSFPEFQEEVEAISPNADAVIPVRALPMRGFPDVHGLDKLVQKTHQLVPEGRRNAFVAAQKVDLDLKSANAQKIINTASAAAGAAATIPLPFSDAITIVPIQLTMIVGISLCFGIDGSAEAILPVAYSMIGCVAATVAGRLIVGQLLKLIPGGSLLNAAVAGTITAGLGKAYLAFLIGYHSTFGRLPTPIEISESFKTFWSTWDQKGDTPEPSAS